MEWLSEGLSQWEYWYIDPDWYLFAPVTAGVFAVVMGCIVMIVRYWRYLSRWNLRASPTAPGRWSSFFIAWIAALLVPAAVLIGLSLAVQPMLFALETLVFAIGITLIGSGLGALVGAASGLVVTERVFAG
jgi:hypothetical protein